MLRCVASGFLPGDDWEAEFESVKLGGAMYFHTLVQYLTYFRGRTAQVVDALGPPNADLDHAWRRRGSASNRASVARLAWPAIRLTMSSVDGSLRMQLCDRWPVQKGR